MICQKCNNTFEKKPKVRKDVKYCEACRWITCEVCHKQKRLTTQQIENPAWGRFCSHKCEKADSAFRFKKNGYWCVKAADHPRAYERGFYYEHILVLEKKLGRLLDTSIETCHHIDGDKLNNSPENLKLHTRADHASYHWPAVSWSEDVGIDHLLLSHHSRKPARTRIKCGHPMEFDPSSTMSDKFGYVVIARKIMADSIGRALDKCEMVLHVDNNKGNNDLSNLRLVKRSNPFQTGEKL